MSSNEVLTTAVAGEASEALVEAFAAFRVAAAELETAYTTLNQETDGLRQQLRQSRSAELAANRGQEIAERLVALLEALPGAVLVLDEAGIIRESNAAAISLLGNTLTGENWASVRGRAFHSHRAGNADLELHDGRRINLAQRPLDGSGGRVLLLTDVTESRRIEELLSRHHRLAVLGEMAASLAHQVRTPLSAALLYATNARRCELPTDQRDALLGRAISCLHDLEGLINDMLGFARGSAISSGRFTFRELLTAVEAQARTALASGQSLDIRCMAPNQILSGHREALTGAVLNLVMNAIEATGDNGHVCVIGDLHGAHAEIAVSDDGPGIAPEIREHVFEPFFTSRPDGTGLGLAVARSVAQAHQGDLLLAEDGSRGATFLIRLPLPDSSVHIEDEVEAA